MYGIARLWDSTTGQQLAVDFKHGPLIDDGVFAFSKDDSKILTWSLDTVKLWDAVTGQQLLPSFKHDGTVRGATFSKDESKILSWSHDRTARLWETATGQQLGPTLKHENEITGATFSKDESKILTWSRDGTARLWDIITGRQLGATLKHKRGIRGAIFSKDETKILTWSDDGTAKLWNIPGDLDFPYEHYALLVQVLSGTKFDPATGRIIALSKTEWEAIRDKYMELAQKHAKDCRYPKENVYLRYFSKEKEINDGNKE